RRLRLADLGLGAPAGAHRQGPRVALLFRPIAESVRYMMSHPETQIEDPEFDDYCDRVIAALEEAKAEILGE
ncbi:MAG: hypothetical protein IKR59_09160, partial [Lachnospiraceae bacterium]|nr:hypothetical protein [Lachnospiraceae bacterium]